MFIINWLHTNTPSQIIVNFGFTSIHWYGLLITLAFIVGFFVARNLFKKYELDLDHLYNLFFYLVIFGLLGARLYHVLNELPYYLENPGQIIAIWNGGLALHGGLFASLIVIWLYLRKYYQKNTIYLVLDILAPAIIIGQAIGRWGNYFNQELYGMPTALPWGIPIEMVNRVAGFESFTYFHPTFLYESLASLVIFIVLMYLHKLYLSCHPRVGGDPEVEKDKPRFPIRSGMTTIHPGFIFSIYLILYSIIRILTEFIRIDITPIILGIRLPIIVSGLLILVGIAIFYQTKRKSLRLL